MSVHRYRGDECLVSVVGKPRFHWNEATILTEALSAVEAWKV